MNAPYAPDMNRRRWCATLAKLVSPAFPVEAGKALADMLPALAYLPDTLFTDATVTHVAMAKRRQSVPAFDEIVHALNDWRATYLPDPTLRLAGRPNADLPPEKCTPPAEEVAAVVAMLAAHRRELAQSQVDAVMARPSIAQLRDVTLKGEALAESRRARGIPGYERASDAPRRDAEDDELEWEVNPHRASL